MDIRRRSATAWVAAVLVIGWAPAFAKGGGHPGGSHAHHAVRGTAHSAKATSHASPTSSRAGVGSRAAPGVSRDSHGRIARSSKARDEFRKSHPCPSTGRTSGACAGHVIDHVQALKHGGADSPGNMQWQTKAEAKAKDRVE
jgi:hypothetical protein